MKLQSFCQNGGVQALTNSFPSSNTLQGSYPGATVTVYYTGGASGSVSTSGTAVTWLSGTLFNANSGWTGIQITIASTAYTISSVNSQTSITLTSSAGTQQAASYSMPSTAPAAIYSDNNGTVKANPYTCDSTTAQQFIYADNGTYDFIFSGAGIAAPFPISAVSGIDPVSVVPAYTSFVAAGGKCDGVTDDTSHFAAALAMAETSGGGGIQFPSGVCLVANGISLTTGSGGVTLQGVPSYPAAGIRGTTIKSTSTTADTLNINAASGPLNGIVIRDVLLEGNTGGSTGNCLHLDASANTMNHIVLDHVIANGCAQDDFYLQGGSGSGGFLFDISMIDPMAIGSTGRGMHTFGRVSEVNVIKPFFNDNAGEALRIDGGTSAEASGFSFIGGTFAGTGGSAYCIALRDASSIDIENTVDMESCSFGNILLQSARGVKVNGGKITQTGTAYGISLDTGASSQPDDSFDISVPWWTNSSNKALIHIVPTPTVNAGILGLSGGKAILPSDVDGSPVVSGGVGLLFPYAPPYYQAISPLSSSTYVQILGWYNGTLQAEVGDGTDGAHVDGPVRVDGGLTHAADGLKVCSTATSCATLTYIHAATAVVSFPGDSIGANTGVQQTITVLGAVAGGIASCTPNSATTSTPTSLSMIQPQVGTDTVTIGYQNVTSSPVTMNHAVTWSCMVVQFM